MDKKNTDNETTSQLTAEQQWQLMKVAYGIQDDRQELPPDDETYAIFTSGDYADREFKRIARPSYRQRIAVEEVRVRSKVVSEAVKEGICKELGWDLAGKATEELSMMEMQKQILPLVTREELPGGWDIGDVNSHEVSRMLYHFLLGT